VFRLLTAELLHLCGELVLRLLVGLLVGEHLLNCGLKLGFDLIYFNLFNLRFLFKLGFEALQLLLKRKQLSIVRKHPPNLYI
jgi:hypothetical protein